MKPPRGQLLGGHCCDLPAKGKSFTGHAELIEAGKGFLRAGGDRRGDGLARGRCAVEGTGVAGVAASKRGFLLPVSCRLAGRCWQGGEGVLGVLGVLGRWHRAQAACAHVCWGTKCNSRVFPSTTPLYVRMTKALIRIFFLRLALEKKN